MSNTHRSPTTNLIRLDDFVDLHQEDCETILPFPAAPWEDQLAEVNNNHLTREEAILDVTQQLEDERRLGARVIFTDGSLMEEGGGAAAVSPTTVRSIGCPAKNITNNELELLAVALAIADFKDHRAKYPSTPNKLAIFSDSQIALKHVTEPLRPQTMQHLARSVKMFIKYLGDTEVKIFWVPGHESIE